MTTSRIFGIESGRNRNYLSVPVPKNSETHSDLLQNRRQDIISSDISESKNDSSDTFGFFGSGNLNTSICIGELHIGKIPTIL